MEDLEQKAFAAAKQLKSQGWSVLRHFTGNAGPTSCRAVLSKGGQQYEASANSHAQALWQVVQEVLELAGR